MKTAEEAAKEASAKANTDIWQLWPFEVYQHGYIAGFESGKAEGFESRQGDFERIEAENSKLWHPMETAPAEESAKEYSDKFKHLSMAERIGAEVWYKDGFESRQSDFDVLQEIVNHQDIHIASLTADVDRLRELLVETNKALASALPANVGVPGNSNIKGFESGKAEAFESRQRGWISVADRLPETKIDGCATANVLAIVEGMTGIQVMNYSHQNGEDEEGEDAVLGVWSNCYGDIRGDGEWDDNYNVTHWQPLPEPPNT